jgi:signal transduction histidine kinase
MNRGRPAGGVACLILCAILLLPLPDARADAGAPTARNRLRVLIRPKAALASPSSKSGSQLPSGMVVDILTEISRRGGWTLSWVEIPPDGDVAAALRTGKGDIAGDWGITDARSREFLFSDPYLTLPVNVIVRKGEKAPATPDALAGLRIAVVARNIADDLLTPRTDLRLVRHASLSDALFDLLSGNVDALAHLGPVLLKEAQAAGIDDRIVVLEPPIAESPRAFTMLKGNEETIARLDRELARFIATPEYRHIHEKWFGKPKPYWDARRIVAANIAFLILVGLAMWGWRTAMLLRANARIAASEAARERAQKYEAVALLAGGMAHNLNNLLTIICGHGEIVRAETGPDDPLQRNIGGILEAADRAAALTGQLLAFSRQSTIFRKVERIDALLTAALPSIRALAGTRIELSVAPEAGEARVSVDPGLFEKMILEVVKNACEAMPSGGRLRIASGQAEIDAVPDAGKPKPAPGRYATLRVVDTGCGMDPDTLAHVFEPFRTTKEFGRGMGLPSVYGLVKQSDGFIDVESTPGAGTKITVYLPLAEEGRGKTAQ